MTALNVTQVAVEQWAVGTPAAQITQVAVEQWAAVATGTIQLNVTQVAIEEWVAIAADGGSGLLSHHITPFGAGGTFAFGTG